MGSFTRPLGLDVVQVPYRGHRAVHAGASIIVAKELKTSTELARRALADTRSLEILAPDWRYSRTGLARVSESLVETGQVARDAKFDPGKIVDDSFLAAAGAVGEK